MPGQGQGRKRAGAEVAPVIEGQIAPATLEELDEPAGRQGHDEIKAAGAVEKNQGDEEDEAEDEDEDDDDDDEADEGEEADEDAEDDEDDEDDEEDEDEKDQADDR